MVLCIIAAYIYTKFILPKQQEREAQHDSTLQGIITQTLDDNEESKKAFMAAEDKIRADNQKIIEAIEKRHADDRAADRAERAADRQTHKEVMQELSAVLRDQTSTIKQSQVATFRIAQHVGLNKRDLASDIERQTGKPVDPSVVETRDEV